MKRGNKVLVAASKQQTERDKIYEHNQSKILNALEDIQATLLRVTTQIDMRRKIRIDEFFPINTDSQLRNFLNKSDGQFNLRREEFENMLYLNVTKNIKLKRPFESNLLSAVFSRDFISSHRWPGPR